MSNPFDVTWDGRPITVERFGDCGNAHGEHAAYGCRFPGNEALGIPKGPAEDRTRRGRTSERDRAPESGPSRWERESVTLNGQRPDR